MEFGVSFFPTDVTIQPVDLAKAVEERGFESLWFAEHSHIPTSRETPWGGVPGARPLPEHYRRTHDQFVALGACASVTGTLKLCTGVTLVAQRDPIWLAKEVASLDVISEGRVIFGIGYGWNEEEMAHHGVEYRSRRALLREKVLMMKALWSQQEASFDGDLLHLAPSWAWPKPVQRPHPPIVMGAGAGPKTISHMVEFCDGWIPLGRHEVDEHVLDALQKALATAGRDASEFELTYYAGRPDEELLHRLERLGFRRMVFGVPPRSPEDVLARLDTLADFLDGHRR